MAATTSIIEELQEIQDLTDITGCFLLRAKDNAIIESTVPLKINDDILWDVSVLRDTFQQFSTGMKHGPLEDITLEGEHGFIFMCNLPPHFILLAMGSEDIHLTMAHLETLDILDRITRKIEEITETLLTMPAKVFAAEGETKQGSSSTNKEEVELLPTIPETPVEFAQRSIIEGLSDADINIMIQSIKGKSDEEKYGILRNVFEALKVQVRSMKGIEFAIFLDKLKDMLLVQCGANLALFDISKYARDFKNQEGPLSPQQVLQIRSRIKNWAQRIIK